MPILYIYLWYYDSSFCVCGLVLNTYNIMGNCTVDLAKWNIWGGGHFWKSAVLSRGGEHKKFKSYLFHHLSVPSFWNKARTIFRSADVNFFRWKVNYPSHYERLTYKFLLHHTHNIWTREKEKILVWLVIIKLYLTERQFQAINIVVPTIFLPFYYSGFISLAVLTKLQLCKAMNFNLKASLSYDRNPYKLTHKPTF